MKTGVIIISSSCSTFHRSVFLNHVCRLTYSVQRAASSGGPRLQRPPAPLSADERKMIDRAKRFADPPTASLKKRQADGASSVSPSPPKQVRLATGIQTAAVSAARKITTRAAAMRQQKQQPLAVQQQTKQLPAAPLNSPANSVPTPKVVKEEVCWLLA